MNIVPLIPITSGMIVSTNVTDSADFDISTSYNASDLVTDPATFLEYESQIGSNLGNDPATDDGTHWLAIGYTNSRRMIDGMMSNQTTRASSIELVVDVGTLYTALVCKTVAAASVTLKIVEGATTVYDETIGMVRTDDVENVWDYLFTEPEYKTVAIFPSVPGFAGARSTLTISSPGGTAKIGEAIFGYGRVIGETLAGSGPRIKDYSVKEFNSFGEATIVERAFTRGAEYVVGINPQDNDRITRILEENRAKVCAFFPSDGMEHYGLTVVGFYTDYSPGLTHRGVIEVTIPIEGIS